MDKLKLIEEARTWIGVPYMHEGRSRTGVDCYGLLIVLAEKFCIDAPIEKGYGLRPSGRHMRLQLERYADPIERSALGIGDILHIKWAIEPQHLAIVSNVDPLRIIHADALVGRVVEHGVTDFWRHKIRGCYRIAD